MLVSRHYCIICHSSSLALTNISPVYLRLKSPILLVSWLPLTEEAGVTEIGQLGSWRREKRERENHCGGVRAVSQNRKHANIHGPWVSREIFDEKNIRRKYWHREWCPHPCHNADNGNTQRWPETRGLCLGSCAIMSQAPELASHWSGSGEIRPLIGWWGPSVEV